MNLILKLRRGEGPFWSRMKRLASRVLSLQLPVNAATKPLFRLLYRLHVGVRESWLQFRRIFWNQPLFCSQCESVGAEFQLEELPYISGFGRIVVGDRVRLSGKSNIIFGSSDPTPEFLVGDRTFIGHACRFHISASIRIGADCLIGGGVLIFDTDGHPLDPERRRRGESAPPEAIRPVVLGDNVWIGSRATVLKGVSIGSGAVVAAESVVTKDVLPMTVVAGNPARMVRRLAAGGPAAAGPDSARSAAYSPSEAP